MFWNIRNTLNSVEKASSTAKNFLTEGKGREGKRSFQTTYSPTKYEFSSCKFLVRFEKALIRGRNFAAKATISDAGGEGGKMLSRSVFHVVGAKFFQPSISGTVTPHTNRNFMGPVT